MGTRNLGESTESLPTSPDSESGLIVPGTDGARKVHVKAMSECKCAKILVSVLFGAAR
jgi:hypothetical protein